MDTPDGHRLGYRQVDGDEHIEVLVATMDTTARWDAIRTLRAWERAHLGLAEGQRLLDVGCGLGDASLALADDVGPTGTIVGIDASAEMLARAGQRSRAAPCAVHCSVGDALDLPAIDRSFDVVRSERTLQWVTDPDAAVAEMSRVLRPGGRIALIDTDWSTFHIEVDDAPLSDRVRKALRVERNRPSNVGTRLGRLLETAGLDVIAETSATQTWRAWDPDEAPAPDGCFSMESLAGDLVDAGQLDPLDADGFVTTIHDAARRDRFSMSLTMYAVVATS